MVCQFRGLSNGSTLLLSREIRKLFTSTVENKIAGYPLDSRGMLAIMDVNDKYNDQRKEAGIRSKYFKIMIYNLLLSNMHRSYKKCSKEQISRLPPSLLSNIRCSAIGYLQLPGDGLQIDCFLEVISVQ